MMVNGIPPSFDGYPEILTVAEACKALEVDTYTLYVLLENGLIWAHKTGRTWSIPRASLVTYVWDETDSIIERLTRYKPCGPDGKVWICDDPNEET